jgi:hypothetical protein
MLGSFVRLFSADCLPESTLIPRPPLRECQRLRAQVFKNPWPPFTLFRPLLAINVGFLAACTGIARPVCAPRRRHRFGRDLFRLFWVVMTLSAIDSGSDASGINARDVNRRLAR